MRKPGWDVILAEQIDAARTKPFAYGSHDCLTWAFDVRAALTGIDDTGPWKGRYTSELGAARVMKRHGVTLSDIGDRLLGEPLPSPLFAQRGDIAFREAYGVVAGDQVLYPGAAGLVARPLWDVEKVWRV
jgi:hypothetical protein